MSQRTFKLQRKTTETDIALRLNIDGTGNANIDTGVGFFNHMLVLLAKHAQFDIDITCKGDLDVDAHHSVEDCGIVLGQALKEALGDKAGIRRYSTQFVPMDEALVMANLDISGRPYCVFHIQLDAPKVGEFDTELCEEFFRAFITNAGLTMHINMQYGKNAHHIIEAAFKATGRALREAVSIDPTIDGVMSTKGLL